MPGDFTHLSMDVIVRMYGVTTATRVNTPTQARFDGTPCVCAHQRRQHAQLIYSCEVPGCACGAFEEVRR